MWVSTAPDDRPTGYVVVDLINGCALVEQITVQSDHQAQGFGRALLDEAERWALERGLAALSGTD